MQTKLLPYVIIGILVAAGVAGASWYFATKQPTPLPGKEFIIPHGSFICGVSEEDFADLRNRLDKFDASVEISRPDIFSADCPEGIYAFRITGLTKENCSEVRETLGELEYIKNFGACVKPSEEPEKPVRAPLETRPLEVP